MMCGTCLSLTHSRCMGAGSCKETVQCLLCQRTTQHQSVRNQVRQNQKREAAKMLESARKKLKSAQVNDCVRVPVPIFDRAKTDQRNLLGVITEVDDKGMFTTATKHGLLAQKFSRNQFEVNDHGLMTTDNIPIEKRHQSMSVREAAVASSLGHGQGFAKCNCNGTCTTNKCKCHKARLQCTSHCHPRNAKCKNNYN